MKKQTLITLLLVIVTIMSVPLPQQAMAQNSTVTIDGVEKTIISTRFIGGDGDDNAFSVDLFLSSDEKEYVNVRGNKNLHAMHKITNLDKTEKKHDGQWYWGVTYTKDGFGKELFKSWGKPNSGYTLFSNGFMVISGDPLPSRKVCGIRLFTGEITDSKYGDGKKHTIEIDFKHEHKAPSPPTLTIGTVTDNSIALSWTHASDNITPQNRLYYKTVYGEIGNYRMEIDAGNATSDIITGLKPETEYEVYLEVYDESGNVQRTPKRTVTTKKAISYGIEIAGTEVTSANCNNLSVIDGVSGTVKYDPSTKTLTLDNASIKTTANEVGIISTIDNLTIQVKGESSISVGGFSAIKTSYSHCTITGGTLKVSGEIFGLYAMIGASMTIEDCIVESDGSVGSNNNDAKMTIKNSILTAKGKGAYKSMQGIQELTLIGCAISQPEGAVYDAALKGVVLNGKLVRTIVKIEPVTLYDLKIAGRPVTSANCNDLSVIDGVSGTVKYDPSTKTLTLDNASIKTTTKEQGIESTIDNLTIQVKKSSSISTEGFSAIKTSHSHCTITGGTLKVSGKLFGLYAMKEASMTIKDCIIESDGSVGTNNEDAKMTIKNSTLTAKSKGLNQSMRGIQELSLEGCAISQPKGAVYNADLKGVALDGQLVRETVKIEPIITYGLKIAGIPVTSANCNNLSVIEGVSGRVKYRPSTKTLTLDNATIKTTTKEQGIESTIDNLTIQVKGSSSISTEGVSAIKTSYSHCTITGGTLKVSGKLFGLYAMKEASMTIKDCIIESDGSVGTDYEDAKMTIKNSTLTAKSKVYTQSMRGIQELSLEGCAITQPKGAVYDASLKGVALDGQLVGETVKIEPVSTYGLEIAGTEVTSANCNNLSVIDGVSGTVKYDPSTKTLTLDNATINKGIIGLQGIYAKSEINIVVKGTVNVISESMCAILCDKPTTISGGGTLNASGIYLEEELTIEGCTVNVKGQHGIMGRDDVTTIKTTLTIKNATVTAEGEEGSICYFKTLTLDGCTISQPAGAAFSESLYGVALNRKLLKTTVKIEPIPHYDIKIAGTPVTSLNCNDLSVIDGVSGTVKYDPSTKTLTLDNATINRVTPGIQGIYANREINIVVKGTVNVTSENNSAIFLEKPTTISGDGTLNASGTNSFAIYAGKELTIEGCTVNVKGRWGISGNKTSAETLTIKNATVTAEGEEGSICDFKTFTFNGCTITQPAGAAFSESLHGVALNGKLVKTTVKIEPIIHYALKIAGTPVTSLNCNDLSVIGGVSGTVKYDPSTSTLTLDNATINRASPGIQGIYANSEINIVVKGSVNVTSENNSAIFLEKPTTISGDGTLNVSGTNSFAIYVGKELTIEGCTIHAKGKWGITGSLNSTATLSIRNATVTAEGEEGSICYFKTFTLNGCTITQPAGAAFSESLHGVALDGKIVTDKVVISPKSTGITSPEAETVLSHKKGIYTLQGIKMNTPFEQLPEGIYIVDGKKVIKK